MIRAASLRRALALLIVSLGLSALGAAHAGQFNANTKGSFFCISKVELRWDENGKVIQDTFVHLFNDYPQDVYIHMYFINGDPPTGNDPGWNHVDTVFLLTSNQPAYWAMSTGMGAPGPVIPPFTVLDPGNPPGRPDPEGSTDRVLRGYVVGWAIIPPNDHQIRWNHLGATATIVNYRDATSWGYNGWHAPVVDDNIANGEEVGTPGDLLFNNVEYAAPYDLLMFNFPTVGSHAYASTNTMVTANGDLTLHPAGVDLRQAGNGPVLTNAVFEVWNGNETKFTGMQRCINCWDQRTMSSYANPNHFLSTLLQTDAAWARVDGKPNSNCVFPPYQSQVAALLGVVARDLTFGLDAGPHDWAGYNLTGVGAQFAEVLWDVTPDPGTLSTDVAQAPAVNATPPADSPQHTAMGAMGTTDAPTGGERGAARGTSPGLRFSSSQPGNLVFLSKVELRWDENNNLIQDTFVHLTNTSTLPVTVQVFFVNGDPPLAQMGAERPHPGWNNKNVRIDLTAQQPVLWSSDRGDAVLGVPGFSDLDPGPPPGRPDPEGSTDRVMRGFIVAWAVDDHCREISGSFLMADAILVNYRDTSAWGYNGYHIPNIFPDGPPGTPSGSPGSLQLGNPNEFESAFQYLAFVFPTFNSLMYSSTTNVAVSAQPDLTLHIVPADLRSNSTGPLTTRETFDVWNINETRFTGMSLCLTCWDQRLTGNYPSPNWFLSAAIQTNLGRARVSGQVSSVCGPSNDVALLGVLASHLLIDNGMSTERAAFGNDLFGAGEHPAVIAADTCGPPCPWDIATSGGPGQDGNIDVFDLFLLLANWNTNGPGADFAPPNNIVDVADLFALLAHWGPCP